MDDVRGRFLGLPHGTTPAAVTTNKTIKMSSFKSSENIQKKEVGQTDLFRIISPLKFTFLYVCILYIRPYGIINHMAL